MPAAVIFDMDGVLVDSYRPHLQSWTHLAVEHGLAITEEQFAATFGRTSREILRELFHVHEPDVVRRMDDRKEAIYRDLIRGRVPVMPGALEVIISLHTAGYLLAIGSSGPPENVELVVAELSLTAWMSAIITGGDVCKGKPDPEVFLLAAERMGVLPEACVVVEDAPAGVEAARRAGMRSVALIGTHSLEALSAADLVIRHLQEELTPEVVQKLGDAPPHPGRPTARCPPCKPRGDNPPAEDLPPR